MISRLWASESGSNLANWTGNGSENAGDELIAF
jgi:hypothetical protein